MSEHTAYEVTPYGAWLHIATNPDQWADLRETVRKLPKKPGSLGLTMIRTEVTEQGRHVPHLVVFVDLAMHDGNTSELVDTIAHESTHAASQLLTHVGQDHDGNAEHYAYLVGWIAGRVWEALDAVTR